MNAGSSNTVTRVSCTHTLPIAGPSFLYALGNQTSTFHQPSAVISLAFQFFGTALAQKSMLAFGVSMSDAASRDARKKVLTVAGASWAWGAGQSLYNVEKGYQKQDVGYGMVAYKAALAGLCLWRGLKDDD
jgi:hypothetical protein